MRATIPAIAAAALASASFAQQQEPRPNAETLDPARLEGFILPHPAKPAWDRHTPTPRGLVTWSEDFEAFDLGPLDGQSGWTGTGLTEIVEGALAPGDRSLRVRTQLSGFDDTFVFLGASPTYERGVGRLDFDLALAPAFPNAPRDFLLDVTSRRTGIVITRLRFAADGRVLALQPLQCSIGTFEDTGAMWDSGVTRWGVEVTSDGEFNLYRDDPSIPGDEATPVYTGVDLTYEDNGDFTPGIDGIQILTFVDSVGSQEAVIDNISFTGSPPPAEPKSLDLFEAQWFTIADEAEELVAADLDGDGDQDFAAALKNEQAIVTLLNSGSGFFSRVDTPLGFSPRDIAAGDIDADGADDLVVVGGVDDSTTTGDDVVWISRSSLGDVTIPLDGLAANGVGTVEVADLNADDAPDVIIGSSADHALGALLNDAAGAVVPVDDAGDLRLFPIDASASFSPSDIAADDVDGDDQADVFVAGSSGSTIITIENLGVDESGVWLGFGSDAVALEGCLGSNVTLAQADGVGTLDLVASGNGVDGVLVGAAAAPLTLLSLQQGPTRADPEEIDVADFDLDGVPDFVTATNAGLCITAGSIAGAEVVHVEDANGRLAEVVVADVDGDGDPDILAATEQSNGQSRLSVYINNATPPLCRPSLLRQIDSDDAFGSAIDIDGDTLAIGAPGSPPGLGRIDVYRRMDGVWTLEDTISVAGPPDPGSPAIPDNGEFGASLDLDADRLIVGAPSFRSESLGGQVGKAFVFERSGTDWSLASTSVGPAEFTGVALADEFGAAVAISGDTIAVGAPGNGMDSGAVVIFELDDISLLPSVLTGASSGDRLGAALALESNLLAAGANGSLNGAGAALVYGRADADSSWLLRDVLTASDGEGGSGGFPDSDSGDSFGVGLALQGGLLLIGAPFKDVAGKLFAGGAYVFTQNMDGSWSEDQILEPAAPEKAGFFGLRIAVSAGTMAIGEPSSSLLAGSSGFAAGLVHTYTRNVDATWSALATLESPDADDSDMLGAGLALDGLQVIAGAPLAGLNDEGAAYVWVLPCEGGVPGDLTGDGSVGAADLSVLLANWGPSSPGELADLTFDGFIDAADLSRLLANWSP